MVITTNEFGYPSCCIHWFTNRINKKNGFELTYLQEMYYKHGFIPCPLCAEKLHKENMKLHQLIIKETRTVKDEFPICEPRSDKQIQEQIEKRNNYNKSSESMSASKTE